jgi:hypothetical protein
VVGPQEPVLAPGLAGRRRLEAWRPTSPWTPSTSSWLPRHSAPENSGPPSDTFARCADQGRTWQSVAAGLGPYSGVGSVAVDWPLAPAAVRRLVGDRVASARPSAGISCAWSGQFAHSNLQKRG